VDTVESIGGAVIFVSWIARYGHKLIPKQQIIPDSVSAEDLPWQTEPWRSNRDNKTSVRQMKPGISKKLLEAPLDKYKLINGNKLCPISHIWINKLD